MSLELLKILIVAIAFVESGGDPHAVNCKEGAYGLLQIREICVKDVNRIAGTAFTHNDAFDPEKAIKMFLVYVTHYATEERIGRDPTIQDAARIWNGGPDGFLEPETIPYWEKVQKRFHRNLWVIGMDKLNSMAFLPVKK